MSPRRLLARMADRRRAIDNEAAELANGLASDIGQAFIAEFGAPTVTKYVCGRPLLEALAATAEVDFFAGVPR